jgi:hypothetical protein
MAKTTAKSTPTKKPLKPTKSAPKQPVTVSGPRKLKAPTYKTLRVSKRIKHPVKLPSVRSIFMQALRVVRAHKGLFFGIAAVYGLLNLLFQGQGLLSGNDIAVLKQYFQLRDGLFIGLSGFAQVAGSSGTASSGVASSFQFFLMVFVSLALIYTLRQLHAAKPVTVRDAYYRCTAPLIPFLLVFLVIVIQLIPLLISSTLYQLVISNGIAVYAAEKFVWIALLSLFSLLSVYFVSSSIFALYIVTLPDMTPLQALRSAKHLVANRRWTVMRKVIVLPLILFVIAALLVVPIIIWLTPLTQVVFFVFTMFGFVLAHTYMYTLYRELIGE